MSTSTIDKVAPYVDRVMNDSDLQDRIRQTVKTGGKTAKRARSKGAKRGAGDAKLRNQAIATIATANGVLNAIQEPPKKPKKRWLRRLLLLAVLAGGAYLATDESARNKVLDAVGGGGDSEGQATA